MTDVDSDWPYSRSVAKSDADIIAVEHSEIVEPNRRENISVEEFSRSGLPAPSRAFANFNRTYGVLGGGVALLIWLYWSGFLILLGTEVNRAMTHQRGNEALIGKQVVVH